MLELDHEQVEVAIELPRVSIRPPISPLARALGRLPDPFTLRVHDGERSTEVPASAIESEALGALMASAESLRVGWAVPREVALAHTALLDEQLADALVALAPVFMILTGRSPPTRKPHGRTVTRQEARELDAATDVRHRFGAAHPPPSSSRGTPQEGEEDPASPRRPERAAAKRARSTAHAAAPAPARATSGLEARRPSDDREARPLRRVALPTSASGRAPRAGSATRPLVRMLTSRHEVSTRRSTSDDAVAAKGPVRGARVRVLVGPFEGKVGVVQELDGKGGARVLLGLLATRFDLGDLTVVDGNDKASIARRFALASSHRRRSTP